MEQARRDGAPASDGGGHLSGCGCTASAIAVRPDGVYVPCTMLSSIELGRIGEDALVDVWRGSPALQRLRLRHLIPLATVRGVPRLRLPGLLHGELPGARLQPHRRGGPAEPRRLPEEIPGRGRHPVNPSLDRLYVYLTEGCNLACRHCWIAPTFDADGTAAPSLPLEVFEQVVAEAKPLGLSERQAHRGRAAAAPAVHGDPRRRPPGGPRPDGRDQRPALFRRGRRRHRPLQGPLRLGESRRRERGHPRADPRREGVLRAGRRGHPRAGGRGTQTAGHHDAPARQRRGGRGSREPGAGARRGLGEVQRPAAHRARGAAPRGGRRARRRGADRARPALRAARRPAAPG